MRTARRFWDTTVVAAAVTASVAGLTAGIGSWLDFRRQEFEFLQNARAARCLAAKEWLADDVVNPDIPLADRKRLTRESLAVGRECLRKR